VNEPVGLYLYMMHLATAFKQIYLKFLFREDEGRSFTLSFPSVKSKLVIIASCARFNSYSFSLLNRGEIQKRSETAPFVLRDLTPTHKIPLTSKSTSIHVFTVRDIMLFLYMTITPFR